MGVRSKEQARKTFSEVYRAVPDRKVGVEVGKQAGNPMLRVWKEKSKKTKKENKQKLTPETYEKFPR